MRLAFVLGMDLLVFAVAEDENRKLASNSRSRAHATKIFVAKRFPTNSFCQGLHTFERIHFAVPLVESESRLVDVAAQVFF